MVLTLEVIGEQAGSLGASRKVFNAIGGTIGRLPDNDWVIADPYISGRHALIRFVQGKYFIEDTSTNGVFINSPDNRLSREQSHQLRHGDVLFIDAYRIKVTLESDQQASKDDPFALLKRDVTKREVTQAMAPPERAKRDVTEAMFPPERGKPDMTEAMPPPERAAKRDMTEALPPPPRSKPKDDRTASLVVGRDEDDDEDDDEGTQWMGLSDMSFEPEAPPPPPPPPREVKPPPAPPRSVAPAKAPPRPAPPPPARAAPAAPQPARAASQPESAPKPAGGDANLDALFAAAGIEGLAPTAQSAQVLGEVLRIAVGGVMDALRARDRMKDDMRMRGTTFKAVDNNPLKFSANVDDAFHNLFVKHNAAYLEPAEAFGEALEDLRDHQAAMLAAMRIAFESMLAQFDPDRLQEDFEKRVKMGSLIGVPAKLRYWDLYRDKYEGVTKNADAGYRRFFGDEFAKAYEEQLERLRSQRGD